MANLATRDIFNELLDFRRSFDRMFKNFITMTPFHAEHEMATISGVPPIESWVDRENKEYHLRIGLPGVDPKDVEVELQGGNLTVRGEHESREEKKEADYVHQEFSYGRFERTVGLPEGIDTSKLTAEYNNGVLEISAPLSEAALPKRIEIKTTVKAKGAGA